MRDLGLIPALGRFLGEGNSYPLQYSGLGNSMDCIVHGVAKSWSQLNDFNSLTYLSDYYKKQNKANSSVTLYILALLSGEGWDGGREETVVSAVYLSKTFSVFAQT